MMGGVNKVILVGNLGRDPESHSFEGGVKKVTFSLATTEPFKDKDGNKVTEWHNIVLWRNLAEIAEKYLRKGSTIYLEGRITTRSWTDKDGNKRTTTEIVGTDMTMLGSSSKEERTPMPPPPAPPAEPGADLPMTELSEANDDLPF